MLDLSAGQPHPGSGFGEWHDNMMQKVQANTAGGYLQVKLGRAFVVSFETRWHQSTVGCACRPGRIGPKQMCRL